MGEVFRAEHIHLHTTRVIKLMRPNLSEETNATERFLREARLATRIQHPNVATLHDFSTLPDGSYYMVWEFIEGKNLTEIMRRDGAFSPRRAAKLAVQILSGLDAIHRAGIIHRDISPDNVMLSFDEDGSEHAKIIDLGIAKQGDEVASQTQTGIFIGKLKYCSPEHLGLLAEGERMDGRADLYSFGIVLYELVAGAPPFQDETPHQYILSHAKKAPRPLRVVNPRLDNAPELEAVIFKALEKDREKRFSSAREFAKALEQIIPVLTDVPATTDRTIAMTYPGGGDATEVTPSPHRDVPTTVTRLAAPPPTAVLGRAGSATTPAAPVHTRDAGLPRDTYVVQPTPVTDTRALPRDTSVAPAPPHVAAAARGGTNRALIAVAVIAGVLLLAAAGAVGAWLLTRDRAEPRKEVVDKPGGTTTVASETTGTAVATSTTTVAPNSNVTVTAATATETTAVATTTETTGAMTQTAPVAVATTPPAAATPPPARPAPAKRAESRPLAAVKPAEEVARVAPPPPPPPRYERGRGRALVDSPEYTNDFRRGIVPDYNALTQGSSVQWIWVAPGVELVNHSIRVGRWRNFTAYEKPEIVPEYLTANMQEEIDGVVSGGPTLTAEGAIVWAGTDRKKKRGMTIEMIFRDAAGAIVAMLRHRIHENAPEDAAEEMPEAVAEFIESNR